MSPYVKRLLIPCFALLSVLFFIAGCHRLNNHRAEEKFRLTVGLGDEPITSGNTATTLLLRFPLHTPKETALKQMVESKILSSNVLLVTNDTFSVTLPYGSSLWPPCGKVMRVDIHFHPSSKSLQSIQTEEVRICP